MAYNFSAFDTRAREIIDWLTREYSGIRTGRATPALLDSIQVESYGTRVPLQQVGSITVEDPKTLRINVWDKSVVRSVEKAIIDSNLGVSVIADAAGVRVIFPELTGERRAQIVKLAKSKLEEARVSLRAARDGAMREIDAAEKNGSMSKDECFSTKEALQKRVDQKNVELETIFKSKEAEILQ